MHDIDMAEVLHRQSREAWERRSAEMEATNKKYLIRINKLFDEKDALGLALKAERNTALLTTVQLRREKLSCKDSKTSAEEGGVSSFRLC